MQILIDAVQELIESHEAAEGGGGGGNGDKGEGERKGGGGGGGVQRGGDGGCVSQLSFADAAPRSQQLNFSGMLPIPGAVPVPYRIVPVRYLSISRYLANFKFFSVFSRLILVYLRPTSLSVPFFDIFFSSVGDP